MPNESNLIKILLEDDPGIVLELDAWMARLLASIRQIIVTLTEEYLSHRRFPIESAPAEELYFLAASIALNRKADGDMSFIPEQTLWNFLLWYEKEGVALIEQLLAN